MKVKPVDIGSLVYSLRIKNENQKDMRGTPVVISSFVESRRELVVRLLESFIGLRDASVLQFFKNAELFIDWVDAKSHKESFFSETYAQQAYRDYTAYLNHQIAHDIWKPTTASQFQAGAARLIELCFPDSYHHVLSGAVKIIPDKGSAAASEIHVELYRDVCLAIALQCGDFVLANKLYPCVVSIRNYEVVVFPSFHGAVGPFKEAPLSYNAAERRIATVEEYISACIGRGGKPGVRSSIALDLAKTQVYLDSSNENNRHWHRLHVAYLAARAYTCLFLLITGATPTELAQFKYEDAQEVEKSPLKKELSAVKFRAGGKSTTYNVGRTTGLPLLKEYLKLRKWILNGVTHESLFFSFPDITQRKNFPTNFAEVSVTQTVTKFYNSISGVFLDPNVPIISARKMRKHKSNGMHYARISPSTIAASLNHTVSVNLSTYAHASPEQQDTEFGQFWQSMRHAAHVIRERSRDRSDGTIGTAAGHCNGFNHPTPVAGVETLVELNCRTQYGCLYCEHYICHSDEEDLHKLLSLQYVINSVRKTVPDVAHAEALYKHLSIRIEFLIEALCDRSDSTRRMVEAVKIKVFEYGEITAFWESRLSRYERLGVTFE